MESLGPGVVEAQNVDTESLGRGGSSVVFPQIINIYNVIFSCHMG